MKKLIATAASVLLVNLSTLAQGTILLQNIGPGLFAGVRGPDGNLIPAGSSQYTIELLAGTSAVSLRPFVTPITTTTWVGSGLFGVGDAERVLPGLAPGSFPFIQLRAWNNSGGITSFDAAVAVGQAYPLSTWFQLQLGGGLSGLGNPGASPPVPAPPLFGMPGWTFIAIPEPSTVVLGVLGAATLLLRRRT
jgi:hypothetical protein